MPKGSKDQTTSREPLASEASPKVEASATSRPKKIEWNKVKLYDKPLYRTPYKFTALMPGRRPKHGVYEPEGWIRAAIESGLVEMGSLEKGGPVGALLEPIRKKTPLPQFDRSTLEKMWTDGIADALKKLDELEQQKK